MGLTTATLMLPGCASMISGTTDDLGVLSNPGGADCTLYQDKANIGRVSQTPGKVIVPRSWSDITRRMQEGRLRSHQRYRRVRR